MKKSKRILYIQQSAGGGGASKCLGFLIDYFHQKGYNLVVVFGNNGPLVERCQRLGIKCFVHRLSTISSVTHSPGISLRKMWSFLAYFIPDLIFIYRIIRQEKIDLVHLNSSKLITAGLAAYLAHAKIVWHIREIILNSPIGYLQKRIINKVADEIIVISREVGRVFGSERVNLIYDGVDIQALKPDASVEELRNRYRLDNRKIFVHLGQLFPAKGSFVFVDAAKILITDGYDAKFFILGGPVVKRNTKAISFKLKQFLKKMLRRESLTWKERLEKYVGKQGLADNFIFTGFRNDIGNFISLADAVVSPHCVAEPFGLTLIEAGALKKPVIATDISPTPEIIKNSETGILIEPNNPVALAHAMEYIIKNPNVAVRMGEKGYERVINNFELRKSLEKVSYLYEHILNE